MDWSKSSITVLPAYNFFCGIVVDCIMMCMRCCKSICRLIDFSQEYQASIILQFTIDDDPVPRMEVQLSVVCVMCV